MARGNQPNQLSLVAALVSVVAVIVCSFPTATSATTLTPHNTAYPGEALFTRDKQALELEDCTQQPHPVPMQDGGIGTADVIGVITINNSNNSSFSNVTITNGTSSNSNSNNTVVGEGEKSKGLNYDPDCGGKDLKRGKETNLMPGPGGGEGVVTPLTTKQSGPSYTATPLHVQGTNDDSVAGGVLPVNIFGHAGVVATSSQQGGDEQFSSHTTESGFAFSGDAAAQQAILETAIAIEKANAMRKYLGLVVPAVDSEGLSYENKTSPQGPPSETSGFALPDIQAVIHGSPIDGNNAANQNIQEMPARPAPAVEMPEGSGEESKPCKECPGYPHNICHLHGTCDNGTCNCHYGFKGLDCSIRMCPGSQIECSGHGDCVSGVCLCHQDWVSVDCSKQLYHCPSAGDDLPECSGITHGTCNKSSGVCECVSPWKGKDCSIMGCPGKAQECSGQGECWYGNCVCHNPYTGFDCSELACPGVPFVCFGHGLCANGSCQCENGWEGTDCSRFRCPGSPECSGNGFCERGLCTCDAHYRGIDCSVRRCPQGDSGTECSDHGTCDSQSGNCTCGSGWGDVACDSRMCPVDAGKGECSANGDCIHGVCSCKEGFLGNTCNEVRCPLDCSGHGVCTEGNCKCDEGWSGSGCEQQLCPSVSGISCNGADAGTCVRGQCVCNVGFKGVACDLATCIGYAPENPSGECSAHGVCNKGTCECSSDIFFGPACEKKRCTGYPESECSKHGICDANGTCICDRGWKSGNCEIKMCPGMPECSGRGMCVEGVCQCQAGWRGDSCASQSCHRGPNGVECSGTGDCRNGVCHCADGWKGVTCEIAEKCPGSPQCSGKGVCDLTNGTCFCDPGWAGAICASRTELSGHCEGGSVWKECAPSNIRTCSNPALTELGCEARCTCDNGTIWDALQQKCVTDRECSPSACGVTLSPAANKFLLGVKTASCGASGKENCVCSNKPLVTCWKAGTTFQKNVLSNAVRVALVLAPRDTEVPSNAGTFMSDMPHLSLGPLELYDREFGQSVSDPALVVSVPGTYTLTLIAERTDSSVQGLTYLFGAKAVFEVRNCTMSASCPSSEHSKECSGHGTCDNGACVCLGGWSGAACNEATCKDGCNNGGVCKEGSCVCAVGYGGATCNTLVCPSGNSTTTDGYCSDKGECSTKGSCECEAGFTGVDCSTVLVTPVCEGGSVWTLCAQDCTPTCPLSVVSSSHFCVPRTSSTSASSWTSTSGTNHTTALCQQSACACPGVAPWWDPIVRKCVTRDECSFNAQRCNTVLSAQGSDAAIAVPSVTCSEASISTTATSNMEDTDVCVCTTQTATKITKYLFSTTATSSGASNVSSSDYSGKLVDVCWKVGDELRLAQNRFVSTAMKLVVRTTRGGVERNFTGGHVTIKEIDSLVTALGGGVLQLDQEVAAEEGFYLLELVTGNVTLAKTVVYAQVCEQSQCPVTEEGECSGRGKCVSGVCECTVGWTGEGCGTFDPCPGTPPCSGNGVCEDSRCICNPGFSLSDCSGLPCAPSCVHGSCLEGSPIHGNTSSCVCEEDYSGITCASSTEEWGSCLMPSVGNFDTNSTHMISTQECSARGICVEGVCNCNPGFVGMFCETRVCVGYPTAECSKRGKCEDGFCVCQDGWGGVVCDQPVCALGSSLSVQCSAHGTCVNATCVCASGFTGAACEFPECSGTPLCNSPHGSCVNGTCVCEKGWRGVTCSEKRCGGFVGGLECSGHGDCGVSGVCDCSPGWAGVACDVLECAGNPPCSKHGTCAQGNCTCDQGWTGLACSISSCPKDANNKECTGNGQCANGTCVCNVGYSGAECSLPQCPTANGLVCGGEGLCVNGACNCRANTTGFACATKLCPQNCSYNGLCVNGTCYCDIGYVGADCSMRMAVPEPIVLTSTANISPGVQSSHVSLKLVSPGQLLANFASSGTSSGTSSSNKKGKASKTANILQTESASELEAELGTGTALLDQCPGKLVYVTCAPARAPSCSLPLGLDDSSLSDANLEVVDHSKQHEKQKHHECVKGCVCPQGTVWNNLERTCTTLDQCAPVKTGCGSGCENGGMCADGTCQCVAGFEGSHCERKQCPGIGTQTGECSSHGNCVDGSCKCNEGFEGIACSVAKCPKDCSGKGDCDENGSCKCHPKFDGQFCEQRRCAVSRDSGAVCGGYSQGVCNSTSGICKCAHGFTGIACDRRVCVPACSVHGKCNHTAGECSCAPGYTGMACENLECPSKCSDRGECSSRGTCHCFPGFEGFDCSKQSCPTREPNVDCSGRGKCDFKIGRCLCESGFTGLDCSIRTCAHNCSHHGTCQESTAECICRESWIGQDCSKHVCDTGCSGHGKCSDHTHIPQHEQYQRHFRNENSAKCVCDSGFSGKTCEIWDCKGDGQPCSGHGTCQNNTCACNPPYKGDQCSLEAHEPTARVTAPHSRGNVPAYSECVFPFLFNGQAYYTCTTDGWSHDEHPQEWCSIDAEFSGRWGVCSAPGTCGGYNGKQCAGNGVCKKLGDASFACECSKGFTGRVCSEKIIRVTQDAANLGKVCEFPFTFRDHVYNDCTSDFNEGGMEWCSVGGSSHTWGVCAPRGTCAGSPSCSGHGYCDTTTAHCKCDVGWKDVDCSKQVTRVATTNDLCRFPFQYHNEQIFDCSFLPPPPFEPFSHLLRSNHSSNMSTTPHHKKHHHHRHCEEESSDESNNNINESEQQQTQNLAQASVGERSVGTNHHKHKHGHLMEQGWCSLEFGDVLEGGKWAPCLPRDVCPGTPSCTGRGKCVEGECECDVGYSGVDCSVYVPLGAIADSEITSKELSALHEFFADTRGHEWTFNSGWTNTDMSVCSWHGVECSDGHVNKIELSNNNLDGSIRFDALEQLEHLRTLNLSHNHLTGNLPSKLPPQLVSLDVSHNHIAGDLPESFLRSETLKALDLSDNYITDQDDVNMRRLRAVIFENNGCHHMVLECEKALFSCEMNCVMGSSPICKARASDCDAVIARQQQQQQ